MLLVHHRRPKARAIAAGAAIPAAPVEPCSSWYPWAVLLSFGALSIWINSLHATARTPETWELQLSGAVPPLGLLLSTHLLVLILHKASQTTGSLPIPLLEEQPAAEVESVSVNEPVEAPEPAAAAAPAPAVELVASPSPVDVPVASPAATAAAAQEAVALELTSEPPTAPAASTASAPAPAAPAVVTPLPLPPRTRTAPAAKRAPALTRVEAYGRYVAELEAGRAVTSDDIASWMHLSPVRSAKTLEQFAVQVREAA